MTQREPWMCMQMRANAGALAGRELSDGVILVAVLGASSTSPLRTARDSVKGYGVAGSQSFRSLTLSILCFKECCLRAHIRRLHGPAWIVDEWNGCRFYV